MKRAKLHFVFLFLVVFFCFPSFIAHSLHANSLVTTPFRQSGDTESLCSTPMTHVNSGYHSNNESIALNLGQSKCCPFFISDNHTGIVAISENTTTTTVNVVATIASVEESVTGGNTTKKIVRFGSKKDIGKHRSLDDDSVSSGAASNVDSSSNQVATSLPGTSSVAKETSVAKDSGIDSGGLSSCSNQTLNEEVQLHKIHHMQKVVLSLCCHGDLKMRLFALFVALFLCLFYIVSLVFSFICLEALYRNIVSHTRNTWTWSHYNDQEYIYW